MDSALCVVGNDLRLWLRKPIHVAMAVLPIFMVLTIVGALLVSAESLPTGVVLMDDDPVAAEIAEYIGEARSGAGLPWWTIEYMGSEEVYAAYAEGRVLCYVTVPAGVSRRLAEGDVVEIGVTVNNVNDDVTKNVRQRMELLCNHFNRDLEVGGVTYGSTGVEFSTLVPRDVAFLEYLIAGVLALTVQLSGGVNTAVAVSREFEEGTVKELVMGSSLASVVAGKMLTGVAETCIVFGFVVAFVSVAYGFAPACGYLPAILLGVYGVLCFSGLGFLAASVIRRTVPSALSMILLNMICWWVGGGLVPGELWAGRFIGYVGSILPGTYFYRSYTSLALTATTHTLWFDVAVVTVFGLLVYVAAVLRFRREATRI